MSPVCTNSILFSGWNTPSATHTYNAKNESTHFNRIQFACHGSSSHTNTNPQCMAANFIEANAFVFRLHLFLVLYTHLKDERARERREKATNDNDFVHTFIVTYVLTFSTIIFGLCGIDTFLFPLTQQRIWIKRKRKN